MRWTYLSLSFIFFLILYSCNSHIEPNDLAQNVLTAFQEKDVELALPYLLNSDDYTNFFSKSTLDENVKERLIEKHPSPEYIAERTKRFKKRFKAIIEKGEELGIVWKDIQFDHLEVPKTEKFHYGVQSDEIYVYFSYKTDLYKLTLDDCCHCSRGWLMSDEPRLRGPIEK